MMEQQESGRKLDADTDLAAFLQSQIVVELFGPEALDPQAENPTLVQFMIEHSGDMRDQVLEDPKLLEEIERDKAKGALSLETREHIEQKIHYHQWAH